MSEKAAQHSGSAMRTIAIRLIQEEYGTQADFCRAHNVDPGNLSNSLSGKIEFPPDILTQLGYVKKYLTVYEEVLELK